MLWQAFTFVKNLQSSGGSLADIRAKVKDHVMDLAGLKYYCLETLETVDFKTRKIMIHIFYCK